MNENCINNNKEVVDILNGKLKATEEKLDKVLKLVYKTFTGNALAAQELSEIVGVAAPILCNEDDESSIRPMKEKHQVEKVSYPETNSRLAGRMDFLNQVMDDHDEMMKKNYQKSVSNKVSSTLRSRARSADRASRCSEHTMFNPYTWNLNQHVDLRDTNLYKPELPNTHSFIQTTPLASRSAKLRPHTRHNDNTDLKVDHLLYNSENRRSTKSKNDVVPDTREYKLTYDGDVNHERPPKPVRLSSSISQKRTASARSKRKLNPHTAFHHLNLQPMDKLDDNTEQLLDAMEKRFQLSTIDLQRRLGISEAGMVGP